MVVAIQTLHRTCGRCTDIEITQYTVNICMYPYFMYDTSSDTLCSSGMITDSRRHLTKTEKCNTGILSFNWLATAPRDTHSYIDNDELSEALIMVGSSLDSSPWLKTVKSDTSKSYCAHTCVCGV
jgi:hypothetical protein